MFYNIFLTYKTVNTLTTSIEKLIKNIFSECSGLLQPLFITLKPYIYVVFYAIMSKYVAF